MFLFAIQAVVKLSHMSQTQAPMWPVTAITSSTAISNAHIGKTHIKAPSSAGRVYLWQHTHWWIPPATCMSLLSALYTCLSPVMYFVDPLFFLLEQTDTPNIALVHLSHWCLTLELHSNVHLFMQKANHALCFSGCHLKSFT